MMPFLCVVSMISYAARFHAAITRRGVPCVRRIGWENFADEGLDEGCFALVDIDPARLELAHQVAERLIALSGKHWSVRASTQRRDLLTGSDFIINSIEVAGLANVRHDFDIPLKYGVNQCIGDTI